MVCVYCNSKTSVINSRHQKRNNTVWRRRQCDSCQAIFTTTEAADYSTSWHVEGHNNKSQPFYRDKLLISILKSCEHRKNALIDASQLTASVIGMLSQYVNNSGVIDYKDIRRTVQVVLNRFDKAASVHYQAFHKA